MHLGPAVSGEGRSDVHDRGRGEGALVIDPLRCTGVGICAHVASRLVDLDRWGFPVVRPGVDGSKDVRAARAAVRACPRRALALVPQASGEPPVTPSTWDVT